MVWPTTCISRHWPAAAPVGDHQPLATANGHRAATLQIHRLVVWVVGSEQALRDGVGHKVAEADFRQQVVQLAHAELAEDAAQAAEVERLDGHVGIAQRAIE